MWHVVRREVWDQVVRRHDFRKFGRVPDWKYDLRLAEAKKHFSVNGAKRTITMAPCDAIADLAKIERKAIDLRALLSEV